MSYWSNFLYTMLTTAGIRALIYFASVTRALTSSEIYCQLWVPSSDSCGITRKILLTAGEIKKALKVFDPCFQIRVYLLPVNVNYRPRGRHFERNEFVDSRLGSRRGWSDEGKMYGMRTLFIEEPRIEKITQSSVSWKWFKKTSDLWRDLSNAAPPLNCHINRS